MMDAPSFFKVRLGCAYFFIGPGLAYGLLTARLPALKKQIQATDGEIGLILFYLGVASLLSLVCGASVIRKFGSSKVLQAGTLLLIISLPLCGLTTNPFLLGVICVLVGFGLGLADVSMNAQGIEIEQYFSRPCLSFTHAAYSLGGVIGSLTGSLFALLTMTPFINFLTMMGCYCCLQPFASAYLLQDAGEKEKIINARKTSFFRIPPFFIIGCGLLATCDYAGEGSVAEWGSLFLNTVKGADEHVAALAFGCFSSTTVIFRFCGDYLRGCIGDFSLALSGSIVATVGMTLVLFSSNPLISLAGYGCMGTGLAPLTPILFSRAGKFPGIAPEEASAIISILAYGGLLFFPPFLGWLADHFGLEKALYTILALCIFLILGTFILRNPKKI